MSAAQAMPLPHQQQPTLRQRLLAGDAAYGLMLCTASPVVAEIVGLCGYDAAVIDANHSPTDTLTTVNILQALGASGSHGIIRVPDNSDLCLKKALDMGPAGVIIPSIDSADAAKKAVASCRYPPLGVRGFSSPTVRASMYGLQPEFSRRPEDAPIIIAQIESELAVGRIPEIAAVDGIDCIMMAPDDLSMSVGKFPEQAQEDLQRLMRRAEEAIVNTGKFLGAFMPNPVSLNAVEMFARGYNIIVGSSDVHLLRENARNDVTRMKGMFSTRPGGPPLFSPVTPGDPKAPSPQQHPVMMARVPQGGTPGGGGFSGLPHMNPLGGGGMQVGMNPNAALLQAGMHHSAAAAAAAAAAAGMGGMQFGVSRRGGRGTPKRCSQCHMPLKEGHKEDCVAWERKLKMRIKMAEANESAPSVSGGEVQGRDETQLVAQAQSAGPKTGEYNGVHAGAAQVAEGAATPMQVEGASSGDAPATGKEAPGSKAVAGAAGLVTADGEKVGDEEGEGEEEDDEVEDIPNEKPEGQ